MAYWPRFFKMIGHPEWQEDDGFQNLADLFANGWQIVPRTREVIAAEDLTEWGRRLDEIGLIWAPVAELPEVIEDPALREAGAFSVIEHPRAGAIETVSAPFLIRGAELAARGPAPELGQHTREVFAELGVSQARLNDLADRGVIGLRRRGNTTRAVYFSSKPSYPFAATSSHFAV